MTLEQKKPQRHQSDVQIARRLATHTHRPTYHRHKHTQAAEMPRAQSMQQSTVWFVDDVESCLLPGRVLLSVSGHSSGLLTLHGGPLRYSLFTLQMDLAEDRLQQLSQHKSASHGEVRALPMDGFRGVAGWCRGCQSPHQRLTQLSTSATVQLPPRSFKRCILLFTVSRRYMCGGNLVNTICRNMVLLPSLSTPSALSTCET